MLDKEFIRKKANSIIRKHNTNNIKELAEFENILVLEDNLGEIYGLYKYIQRTKLIIINQQLSDDHKKIVLAHEIGHAILHPYSNCAFSKKACYFKQTEEIEANTFAYHLLKCSGTWDELIIHTNSISHVDEGFLDAVYNIDNGRQLK